MQAERIAQLPRWKRGDLTDRLRNHMYAESVYERQVGEVHQVIERVVPRNRTTQDSRPFYRLVEVKNGEPTAVRTTDTQREARAAADSRATRDDIDRRLSELGAAR